MPVVAQRPVPNVVRCIVHSAVQTVNQVNVFHVAVDPGSGISQGEVTTIATGVRNAFKNNYRPQLSNELTLKEVFALDLSTDLGAQATVSGSDTGAIASAAMSANIAMCVTWTIQRHYKGGHPRTYLGGVPGQWANSNTGWSPAAVTAINGATTAFLAAVNAIVPSSGRTATLVAVHRVRNGAVLTNPLVSNITGGFIDTRIDSQRRRLGRDR
jgi:hypothetical protein